MLSYEEKEILKGGNKDKFLLYWPTSIFKEGNLFKDPGEIPKALVNLGFESVVVTGKYDKGIDNKRIRFAETNVFTSGKTGQIKEAIKALFITLHERPNLVMVYHKFPGSTVYTILFRIAKIISRSIRNSKLIIKLDSDGTVENARMMRGNMILSLLAETILADRVIIESPNARERITSFPVNKKNIDFVPNSYSGDLINSSTREPLKRVNRILCVARFSPEKDLETLIKSFSRMSRAAPEWKMRISGRVSDLAYYLKIKNMVDSLGLESKIELLTDRSRDDLVEDYRTSSIFAILSKRESFCISRVEAAAFGLPVVTTRVGNYEIPGFRTVEVGDYDGASDEMLNLALHPDEREKAANISIESIRKWDDILAELLSNISRDKFNFVGVKDVLSS